MSSKLFFYKKQRRAMLAAFNPYLKKDIEKLRVKLGIPEGGLSTSDKADKWYNEHYQKAKGKPFKGKNPWNWHLPPEFVEMLDSFSFSQEPSRVNFDPKVPLDHNAMELIRKYGLPEKMVDDLKSYILKPAHNFPGIPSPLQPIFIPINEGVEGIKYLVIVGGLDESITQKQWLGVWREYQQILGMKGIKSVPNRRSRDKILLRNLAFWKQVREEGKSVKDVVKDVLDEWNKKHPTPTWKGAIWEDTVRKAIQEIDNLMKPVSSSKNDHDGGH